jgi:ABC-type branched-subunit amino acid transport system ATPase component
MDLFRPQAANPVKDDGATVPISTIVRALNLNVGLLAFNVGMTKLIAEQSVHVTLRVANRALALRTGRLVLGGNAKTLTLESGTKEAYVGAVS